MKRALLIHWRPEEADAALARIRDAGWEAECVRPSGENLRPSRRNPPAVFIIDLTRLPSTGRDIAVALRQSPATRHVPLIFAAGAPEKVASVRDVLPDAIFCQWDEIADALRRAIATMPDEPIVPAPMAGYSGTPLFRKLGIKAGSRLCLIRAPQGFTARLTVPPGVEIREHAAESERVLLFARSLSDLQRGFDAAANAVAEKGGMWILWPKRASGTDTDITQPLVRAYALQKGWVDYKICAVDETWSGLLFSRSRK